MGGIKGWQLSPRRTHDQPSYLPDRSSGIISAAYKQRTPTMTHALLPAGQKRPGPGRPPFEPTPAQRSLVRTLAGLGQPQEAICQHIQHGSSPISPNTLRKYFAVELEHGTHDANARVAKTLFEMATSGNVPAATFFWLKTRARWTETPQQVAFTNPDGTPAQAPTLADFYATVRSVEKVKADGDLDQAGE